MCEVCGNSGEQVPPKLFVASSISMFMMESGIHFSKACVFLKEITLLDMCWVKQNGAVYDETLMGSSFMRKISPSRPRRCVDGPLWAPSIANKTDHMSENVWKVMEVSLNSHLSQEVLPNSREFWI